MILTGLIGWPVAHSKSPAMHNAAFEATGLDGRYVLLPVPPKQIAEAVAGLRALGFRGANVTVPHKQAVIPFLDDLTPEARAIGAVNTIIVQDNGRLLGTNTDAAGFLRDLQKLDVLNSAKPPQNALVLGAGGSARAVAYALASQNMATQVLARRPQQAAELVASLMPYLPATARVSAHAWSEIYQLAAQAQLIVNCTPVGMHPHTEAMPWPQDLPFRSHHVIYDLVYNPRPTVLITQARAAGAKAYHGLGMLVQQGALAWELWTGRPAPVATMQAAVSVKRQT